jgi:alkylation response protein AidB-like acyl-CoA dehydrogenase
MTEEFGYRDAPLVNAIGWGLAAGALLYGGTEEQRQRFLPPIARMETFWVEGYTEPGSGSDLAGLTTRAERDGDGWVINGQKTYTTWGSRGDVIFLAARTDPGAPRHRGISIFCVGMHLPGVTVSPLHNLGGGRQNHTFFDDVRVSDDMLIGEQGHGWELIMNAFYGGGANAGHAGYQRRLEKLTEYCKVTRRGGHLMIDDPVIRDQLAELAIGVEEMRLLAYDSLGNSQAGRPPAFGGAIGTVVFKESVPRFTEICDQILGPVSQLSAGSPWAPVGGEPEAWYRQSFGNHAGGTSQVKRMVLATRGLGLPR